MGLPKAINHSQLTRRLGWKHPGFRSVRLGFGRGQRTQRLFAPPGVLFYFHAILVTVSFRPGIQTPCKRSTEKTPPPPPPPPHDAVAGAEAGCLTLQGRGGSKDLRQKNEGTVKSQCISGPGPKHPGGVKGCRTFEAGVLIQSAEESATHVRWKSLLMTPRTAVRSSERHLAS